MNQKGFSPIAVILLVVLVGLVGATGWYVYKNNKSTVSDTAAQTTTSNNAKPIKTTEKPKENTITNSTKAGWKTFRNYSVGYKVEFPDTSTTSKCEKSSYVFDNYGKKVIANPEHYTATDGEASTTVIESTSDKGVIYITSGNTSKLSGLSKSTNLPDRDIYLNCEQINATAELLDSYYSINASAEMPGYLFTNIHPRIQKAEAKEIDGILKSLYPESKVTTSLEAKDANGRQNVKLSSALTNGRVSVYYYPDKKILVVWPLGQSCNAATGADGSFTCHDTEIIDSFRII